MSQKIDFTTLGFAYATVSRKEFTFSATAFSYQDIPGHTFSFSAKVGGVYRISYCTVYAAPATTPASDVEEFDIDLLVVSGGSPLFDSEFTRNLMTGVHGMQRRCDVYVRATSTTVSVKTQCLVSNTNITVKVYNALFTAERIA